MRDQVKRLFRTCSNALTTTVHERIGGLELRLDDMRAHSNQVEAKLDYLIALLDAQRQVFEAEVHDIANQVRELGNIAAQVREIRSRTEDLKHQVQDLAEDDGALLQGVIHIAESLHTLEDLTHHSAIEPSRVDH